MSKLQSVTLSNGPNEEDPLTKMLEPPPDETPAQEQERLRVESIAKQVSDDIDQEIEKERVAERKGPKSLKVLLLGKP
jgi:guanine nucleotide-binding protein alpha-1 subunit